MHYDLVGRVLNYAMKKEVCYEKKVLTFIPNVL